MDLEQNPYTPLGREAAKSLEDAGFRLGDAEDFLALADDERREVGKRLAAHHEAIRGVAPAIWDAMRYGQFPLPPTPEDAFEDYWRDASRRIYLARHGGVETAVAIRKAARAAFLEGVAYARSSGPAAAIPIPFDKLPAGPVDPYGPVRVGLPD